MRNFIRTLFRTNQYASKLIRFITELPLPPKTLNQLSMLYLQSETDRPELGRFLTRAIKRVKDIPTSDNVTLSKSAIIKPASADEKGIILVGFEHELDKITSSKSFDEIINRYEILFMPTWQPFYSDALLRMLKKAKDSLILLPSSESCYYKALALPEHLRTLPFHASSWINHDLYTPKPKDIDILMVANFATYKRHILLFEALKDLPETLNIVLIGRPLKDRTAKDILREASRFGVEKRFRIIESPTDDVVTDALCRAKLVLGLSGREGSYVSLAEALFADAAVAVFANAHIGTKNYINPKTGFLLQTDRPLSVQVKQCLQLIKDLSPRDWALNNISAHRNVALLNKLMRAQANRKDISWVKNCEPFYIQSFQIYPTTAAWSDDIRSQLDSLAFAGVVFRTQLQNFEKPLRNSEKIMLSNH